MFGMLGRDCPEPDFAGVNREPVNRNYGVITGLNSPAQNSVETLYKATRVIQSQTFD